MYKTINAPIYNVVLKYYSTWSTILHISNGSSFSSIQILLCDNGALSNSSYFLWLLYNQFIRNFYFCLFLFKFIKLTNHSSVFCTNHQCTDLQCCAQLLPYGDDQTYTENLTMESWDNTTVQECKNYDQTIISPLSLPLEKNYSVSETQCNAFFFLHFVFFFFFCYNFC